MRHGYFGRKLGRDTNARKALASNLASSLLEKGQVKTTLAKAKFARPYVEKLITQAKTRNDLHTSRVIASFLSKQAFEKLKTAIGPGFRERSGGYTRIVKLGKRVGDSAPLARLELLKVEKPKATESTQEKKKPIATHQPKSKQNEKPTPKI